jgi:hypothetical protein
VCRLVKVSSHLQIQLGPRVSKQCPAVKLAQSQETLRVLTTSSPKSSFVEPQLTDGELEAGRNLNVQRRSDLGYRDPVHAILGVSVMSSGSARSGNTIFYDAQFRGDLASTPSPVPALPEGMASTGRSGGTAGPSPLSAASIRAASQSEESPVHQADQPDGREPHDDAADHLDGPIPGLTICISFLY